MNFIEKIIAKCVCKGIELYTQKYKLVLNGNIEIIPLQQKDYDKHILRVFQNNKDAVSDYLGNAPTTVPQVEQITR